MDTYNKFKFAKGWTKEKVRQQVKRFNNGKLAAKRYGTDNCNCQYLTVDDNRCFIGAFIPDGHAGLNYNKAVAELLHQYPDLWEFMPFDSSDILRRFQESHDELLHGNVCGNTYASLDNFLEQCED